MGKRKIALFFDEDTEDGKQILEFLTPFSKRKSDIVGELVLLWISEHGTNVPVQWLDRKAERKRGSSEFIKAFEVPSSCTFGNLKPVGGQPRIYHQQPAGAGPNLYGKERDSLPGEDSKEHENLSSPHIQSQGTA